jgi:hypothetical protein
VKRRVFNVLTAMSLVLCALAIVSWATSRFHTDWLFWTHDHDQWFVATPSDQFRLEHLNSQDRFANNGFSYRSDPPTVLERVPGSKAYVWSHGFGLATGERWQAYHEVILLPYWFLVFVVSCLPAWYLWKRLKNQRRTRGSCDRCGYDLRATPERCPECGTIRVQTASATPSTVAAGRVATSYLS